MQGEEGRERKGERGRAREEGRKERKGERRERAREEGRERKGERGREREEGRDKVEKREIEGDNKDEKWGVRTSQQDTIS
jgi:hypothetical protein